MRHRGLSLRADPRCTSAADGGTAAGHLALLQHVHAPDPEQVIDVPKFLPDDVPMRTAVRVTQLAEQLVEVPTNLGYALAVVASKLFSRREIRGVLSGQGSTASRAALIVDTPVPRVRRGG